MRASFYNLGGFMDPFEHGKFRFLPFGFWQQKGEACSELMS